MEYEGVMFTLVELTYLGMVWIAPEVRWGKTYESTAIALAAEAEAAPIWTGKDGPLRTVSLDLAIGEYESTFLPDAEGDCQENGHPVRHPFGEPCPKGSKPQSLGFFQIGVSNLAALGAKQADLVLVSRAAPLAHQLVKASFAVCRGRPETELLGNYAYGRGACGGPKGEGLPESKHRMLRAKVIFAFLKKTRDSS